MARFNQTIAYLTVLALIFKTTSASFDICLGLRGPKGFWRREVVSFKLWNEAGEEAAQYRTIYSAAKTKMENNGWSLELKFSTLLGWLSLQSISVTSDTYGNIGEVKWEDICPKWVPGYRLYYACFSNDKNNYCHTNRKNHTRFCRSALEMGSETLKCMID